MILVRHRGSSLHRALLTIFLVSWNMLPCIATTLAPSLADDLFDKYVAAIPGAIWSNDDYWNNNADGSVNRHLLKIPKISVNQMKDLCFTADDQRPWCLTPEAQLIPENQLPDDKYRYSYVTPLGSTTAEKSTFICLFLRAYYLSYTRKFLLILILIYLKICFPL